MKSLWTHLTAIIILAVIAGCISPELRTARISVKERDFDRALKFALAEIARNPSNPEPYYIVGMVYEQKRDWVKMAENFDKSLEMGPLFAEPIKNSRNWWVSVYSKRAMNCADHADSLSKLPEAPPEPIAAFYDSSLAYVDTAIIVNNQEARLFQHGAITAYYAKQYDRAVHYAEAAISLENPNNPDLPMRDVLLRIYREKDDKPGILKWAEEVIKVVNIEQDTSAYINALDALVTTYQEMNEPEAAQKVIVDAVSKLPERVDIRLNLAFLLMKKKNYDEAVIVYRQILELDPNNVDANLSIGTYLANKDKYEEATPYLEKALTQDPANRVALQNLMSIYYNSGKMDKGADMKKRLEALPPK